MRHCCATLLSISSTGELYIFCTCRTVYTRCLESFLTSIHVGRKSEGTVADYTGGRPHIIYNQKTQKYVLWSNEDTGYTVATSDAPNGQFTVVGQAALDPQFDGLQPADHTVTTIGKSLDLVGCSHCSYQSG